MNIIRLTFMILLLLSFQVNAGVFNFGTSVSDESYNATTWNGEIAVAPSKNAVRDKIETVGSASVSDDAYDESTWDGETAVAPSKNAVRDKIETIGSASVSDEGYNATSWDGNTTISPSKNAVRDKFESLGTGGDVIAPGSNTDNYVPQWDGGDSKTLKNGFPITAAGKSILDDASVTVMRTTLGLGTAAVRAAEDTLTNGSNLPDGAAIKVYGDANWGVTGLWNDAGQYIYPDAGTGYRLLDAGTDLTTVTFASNTCYVLTPGATYDIDSNIDLSGTYTTLMGYGATIKKTAACMVCITGSHCKLIGFTVNGNSQNSLNVYVTGAYNEINGITVHHSANDSGIGLTNATAQFNLVTNCLSYSNYKKGIALWMSKYNTISNNICHSNSQDGFTCDGTPTYPAYGNVYIGNVSYNNSSSGFGIDSAHYCTFTANHAFSNGDVTHLLNGMTTWNIEGPSSHLTFNGNVVDSNYGYGICLGPGTSCGGVGSGTSSYCKIVGNIYQGNTVGDYYTGGASNCDIIEATSGGIGSILEDTTPQLGGELDTNGKNITGLGVIVVSDGDRLRIGTNTDMLIRNDGTYNRIDLQASDDFILYDLANSDEFMRACRNGAVTLSYDGSAKFATSSTGTTISGYTTLDGTYGDMKIGEQTIDANPFSAIGIDGTNNFVIYDLSANKAMIGCYQDAFVKLYYNGLGKLQTSATGITVTGACSGCDYVFEPEYDLMPLDELDAYIKEHECLPNMTVNNGKEIEFNSLRQESIEKIEELTLYVLQIHERLKVLEAIQ